MSSETGRRELVALYRRIARTYDWWGALGSPLRRGAVAALDLRPEDVVLDVGCGTGLAFRHIHSRIGPRGTLIGIDISADMLKRARRRIARKGWKNVLLIEAVAEDATVPIQPDAVLFSWVPNVLENPRALENLFGQAKPGARVAALGDKRPSRWAVVSRLYGWVLDRIYGPRSKFMDYEQPWRALSEFVPDLRVKAAGLQATYRAWGRLPSSARRRDGTAQGG